jgi:carnosine N-methyltransferase
VQAISTLCHAGIIGPLLWHFENSGNPLDTSIELSLDEVLALAEKIGFKIGNQKMVDTKYVGIEDSMLSHVYHASFWTATKK